MAAALQTVTDVPRLPRRTADAYKGTFGTVLVVAGHRGTSGAAVLCGTAALRGGAGLVRVACPQNVQDVVAAGHPAYMTAGIPLQADCTFTAGAAAAVGALAEGADALAVGPGLGHRPDVGELVRFLLLEHPDKPTVLDADALNCLPPIPAAVRDRTAPLVLTPHPGEFARLLNETVKDVQADRQAKATAFAAEWKAVVLLKGHGTVVTDGGRVYVNGTGNPGMATGGVGDALTGLVAAFLAAGLSGFDAAVLGARVHGRAGDLAAADLGQTALLATDLINYLPFALHEVED